LRPKPKARFRPRYLIVPALIIAPLHFVVCHSLLWLALHLGYSPAPPGILAFRPLEGLIAGLLSLFAFGFYVVGPYIYEIEWSWFWGILFSSLFYAVAGAVVFRTFVTPRQLRRQPGFCHHCGYDLRGSYDPEASRTDCPECGTPYHGKPFDPK
jgi:hypothetical protein